jgi:hypothetical protein
MRAMMDRYLDALDRFRAATAGDPTQALRLEDGHLPDEQAADIFAYVFDRQPSRSRHDLSSDPGTENTRTMTSERIQVAVGNEGRHLFDAIRDPRVRIVTLSEDVQPDLIVFPCSRFRRFDNVPAVKLSDRLRAAIETRAVSLVFDSSLEGVPHKPDITAALHQVIHQLGAVPQQCVYVTQDRQYEGDYRAHCVTHGIEPVHVLTHDYWIWDSLKEYQSGGVEVFERRLEAFRNRSAHRDRKFVSLNRTPRPTKILFLLRLMRDSLWDEAFVSFGGFKRKMDAPGKGRPSVDQLTRALPGFEDLVQELAPQLDRLDGVGRLLLGLEQFGWKNIDLSRASTAMDLAEYGESWFSVITETEMRARPARITEKVIKPLVNFHPLLVLGNPGALRMIREYGFVTFDELFDETYDDLLDPRQRFEHVYAQVVRLCEWSDEEWQRAEQSVVDKLVFNARWGLTEFPDAYRRDRDPVLVDLILGVTRARV